MTMRYSCFTNIDEAKNVDWPTDFVFPPRIGDRVEGRRDHGRLEGSRPTLKVVSITHAVDNDKRPIVYVELHK